MLSKISWSQYLTTVLAILVLYYLYVFIRYYASDLQKGPSQRKQPIPDPATSYSNAAEVEEPSYKSTDMASENTDDSFEKIELLIEELKQYMEVESKSLLVNDNIAHDLKQIVGKYHSLKYTPYKSAINELILAECSKYGLATLDENDVDGLWE
ncbi:hypothetical protein DBR11_11470 [Pedobacter sp. HMWF019]|uniref:hypothetical protein n=1 Tax=Pedobacter sp. HMWF019 TaxID=2056856 RepID=UPI000D3C2607|nr:hypothetical protein [Pedobacter sp. HMWF019]PTS99885.1 hypothetical protein DBR11_11470 [Pedobacter sp. HMWF019]